MAEEQEDRIEARKVDLSDSGLSEGAKSKLDPNQDAWEFPAPPPGGKLYNLRLHLGSDGFKAYEVVKDDPESVVYSCALECRIESDDKEVDGQPVFPRVSTRIGRGKDISTMAAVVALCGVKIDSTKEYSPLRIAKAMEKLLKKDPTPLIKGCLLDWQGTRQLPNGNWDTVFRSMADFPKDKKGRPMHIVSVSRKDGGKDEVRARLYVKKWPVGGKPVEVEEAEPEVETANVVSAADIPIEDEAELTL